MRIIKSILFNLIICNLIITLASALATTTNSTISPITAYKNSTLMGACSATTNNTLTGFNYSWYNNGILNITGYFTNSTSLYQENANETTLSGNATDGNYNTYAFMDDSKINYTKPNLTIGATWQVKDTEGITVNLTIPASCFYYTATKLLLSFTWYSEGRTDQWACNTPFYSLRDYDYAGFFSKIYEEGIYWTISNIINTSETNINSFSNGFSKGDNITFSCLANDADGNASWLNSGSVMILNSAPEQYAAPSFNNCSIGHCFNVTASVFDIDGYADIINISVAASNGSCNVSGNSSSGIYFNVTFNCTGTAQTITNITINITDSSGDQINLSANNTYPNSAPSAVNITSIPSPGTPVDNRTCLYDFYDADGDNESAVYFNWTINGTLSSVHTQNISAGNYSSGDNVSCSVMVSDGWINSSWNTSSTITIDDSTPPNINNLYVSSTNAYTTDSVTFNANVTDNESLINSNACKFTLRKSDYDGGNGLGNPWNYTTNTIAGNIVSFGLTMAGLGIGTLEWQAAYCSDSSGNIANNTAVGINITITVYVPPSGGGGGGGASDEACGFEILQPSGVDHQATAYCDSGNPIAPLKFTFYNTIGMNKLFMGTVSAPGCVLSPQSIVAEGNSRVSMNLVNCTCPTESTKFQVNIIQESCNQAINVELIPSFLSALTGDPLLLLMVIFLIGIVVVVIIVLIAMASR